MCREIEVGVFGPGADTVSTPLVNQTVCDVAASCWTRADNLDNLQLQMHHIRENAAS